MRRLALGQHVGRWSSALLALWAVGALLPPVEAGCLTHYLTSASPPQAGLAHLELLNRWGEPAAEGAPTPHERPAPCTGAFCSGSPAVPAPAMPSGLAEASGEWALPALPIPAIDQESLSSRPVDASLRPVDRSCSIFHPPRPRPRPDTSLPSS